MRTSVKLLILIALFAGGGLGFFLNRSRVLKTGDERFDKILNRKGVHLARALDSTRYLLVNFWASWCPPCVEEMPSLIAFTQAHREFFFVAISQDSSRKELQTYLKAFPDLQAKADAMYMDEDKSAGMSFHVEQLPETYVYDLKTHALLRIAGAIDWSKPEVLPQIENDLKTSGPK